MGWNGMEWSGGPVFQVQEAGFVAVEERREERRGKKNERTGESDTVTQ